MRADVRARLSHSRERDADRRRGPPRDRRSRRCDDHDGARPRPRRPPRSGSTWARETRPPSPSTSPTTPPVRSRSIPTHPRSATLQADAATRSTAPCAVAGRRPNPSSEAWLEQFWQRTDIVVEGDPAAQQAIRWNLFQMAQASAQVGGRGIAAKAVTAGGYDGHYFWDTEIYVLPLLAYNNPRGARPAQVPLPHAARRSPPGGRDVAARCAVPVAHDQRRGGLGLLPGGHGAVPHRRRRGVRHRPLRHGHRRHRVPARRGRRDPRRAGAAVRRPRLLRPQRPAALPPARCHRPRRVHGGGRRQRLHQRDGAVHAATRRRRRRLVAFRTCPIGTRGSSSPPVSPTPRSTHGSAPPMRCACCTTRRSASTRRTTRSSTTSRGTGTDTPDERYPLLLNFHPLVIYRHQVLKQADVVLAMFLRSDEFTLEAQTPQLRLLRPDHHRRLVTLGLRAVDHGGRGRARRSGDALLHPVAVPRHRRHPRQHGRRRAHRQRRRGVGGARARLRRRSRLVRASSRARHACRPIGQRCASGSIGAAATSRSPSIPTGRSSRSSPGAPCRSAPATR